LFTADTSTITITAIAWTAALHKQKNLMLKYNKKYKVNIKAKKSDYAT